MHFHCGRGTALLTALNSARAQRRATDALSCGPVQAGVMGSATSQNAPLSATERVVTALDAALPFVPRDLHRLTAEYARAFGADFDLDTCLAAVPAREGESIRITNLISRSPPQQRCARPRRSPRPL
jgi:hypothetical protein